jgi:predicted ATP-dependent endonuclease of OLD family
VRYKSFRIKNFKGIRDTTIHLSSLTDASVFSLVGLNESGKTTVLEAIYSFSPDAKTEEVVGGEDGVGVPIKKRVPRHLISSFTGSVSVYAILSATVEKIETVVSSILNKHGLNFRFKENAPDIHLERSQKFVDGDFKASLLLLKNNFEVKDKGKRKWRSATSKEWISVSLSFYGFTPDIAYFPTFVFDFPEFVYLTDRGGPVHEFYRSVFQDVLDQDGRNHTIEKDIVRRVRSTKLALPWMTFLTEWQNHDDRAKIQQVLDFASASLTKMVIGRWNEIFNEKTTGKEINVTYEVIEGEVENAAGTLVKTIDHDVKIKFEIKDGARRFPINDRSLGFRWFFSFLLFTQFRVARSSIRPILFLFDEPAANLHAAAQKRLIECFPEVGKAPHTLLYSTHSHYMIEPKWLEQTYIVSNRADSPQKSIIDEVSLDDDSLDVQVQSYRSFVNNHPNSISYFQPILDRLDVVPSSFDMFQPSVVVEGKSDYYILRYCMKLLQREHVSLIPALGAGTFGALAGLHVGWNLRFVFLLDGDKEGVNQKKRYAAEYGIPFDLLMTLTEVEASLTDIEDLVDSQAMGIIKAQLQLDTKPTKSQMGRFFQENLAGNTIVDLGDGFRAVATILLDKLLALFPPLHPQLDPTTPRV